ncbi:MAG: guanine deaminase [Proteobacteria bacterium]|nr:guanine deaminase [Pseudomonadota bacterium]
MPHQTLAVQGTIVHFVADPFQSSEASCVEVFDPGILFIENGYVYSVGPAEKMKKLIPEGIKTTDYGSKIILPGFVDTHLHYPQTDIIGSFGKQLLDWLETYTFPKEGQFSDPGYATEVVNFFFEEILKNGTTTAQVMPTIHKQSAEIFFQKALQLNMRMISGKVLMDRNAPDFLRDTPEQGYEDSLDLIKKWHERGRISYAVTPRFAVTSTEEQLEKASDLLKKAEGLYLHTHLAENVAEVQFVSELFPWSKNYLDVYDRYNLVRDRSVFAHSIHLPEESYTSLSQNDAAVSFCPTSNLFIGSGLFNLEQTKSHKIKTGIGTDVGGGTSFSMLRTLGEAYKILQLQGQTLSAFKAFYLATLGGAEALALDEDIGNFQPGKEADFIVLNLDATPLIQRRMALCETTEQKLFLLMTLGDDRSIEATHIMGERRYFRS